jgi:hypothetical protein
MNVVKPLPEPPRYFPVITNSVATRIVQIVFEELKDSLPDDPLHAEAFLREYAATGKPFWPNFIIPAIIKYREEHLR